MIELIVVVMGDIPVSEMEQLRIRVIPLLGVDAVLDMKLAKRLGVGFAIRRNKEESKGNT